VVRFQAEKKFVYFPKRKDRHVAVSSFLSNVYIGPVIGRKSGRDVRLTTEHYLVSSVRIRRRLSPFPIYLHTNN
jgi:hypothetical protein